MQYVTRRMGRRDPLQPHRRAPSRRPPRPRASATRRSAIVVASLCLAVGVACTGSPDSTATPGTTTPATGVLEELAVGPSGTVPATMPVPEGYVIPDTRNVRLAPLIARPRVGIDHTKPLLPMNTGTSKLKGRVFDPDGKPLEGATVRLQRFVSEDHGILDVGTDKDGEWHAETLPGGRYRVRAWLKPALTVVEPRQLFLLADHGEAEIDVTMEKHDGVVVVGALDVPDPHVGQVVTFRGFVAQESVDDNGIVVGVGIPAAAVQLSATDAGLRIIGADVGTTDPAGFVLFSVACLSTGDHSVIIDSSGKQLAVGLPPCLEGSLDDLPPDAPLFALGDTFTVPFEGPLPPGTYVATSPGNCGTSYEEFAGTWARNVSLDRTLVFSNPTRSLSPLAGSKPCTFKRTK